MVSLLAPSMNPSILCKLQDSTNTLTPISDWLLISPYSITFESNVDYHQYKELMIFKQTLPVITIENVERSVWRV